MRGAETGAPAMPRRTPRGSVILPLPWSLLPSLAPSLALAEAVFDRKDELHLTVLSRAETSAVCAALGAVALDAGLSRHDWSVRITPRWFVLRADEDGRTVHSVIAEADCPALNSCRRALAHTSGVALADTLPHVTVFLAGTTKGIGLSSLVEFEARRVRRLDERDELFAD